jgi:hypothetical protein
LVFSISLISEKRYYLSYLQLIIMLFLAIPNFSFNQG